MKNNRLNYKDIYKPFLVLHSFILFLVVFVLLDKYTATINFFWSENFSFQEGLKNFLELMQSTGSISELAQSAEYQSLVQQIAAPLMFLFVVQYALIFLGFYTIFRILQIALEKIQIGKSNINVDLTSSQLSKKIAFTSLLFILGPVFALPVIFASIYKKFINSIVLKDKTIIFTQSPIFFWLIFIASIYFPFKIATDIIANNANTTTILVASVLLVCTLPIFFAFIMKWLVTFIYKDKIILPAYKYSDAIGYFFKHLLLTIASLGIYFPVFLSKIYQYLIENLRIFNYSHNMQITTNLNHKKGFIIFWKYFILSIITLGFAFPILITKRLNFVLGNISTNIYPHEIRSTNNE